MPNNPLSMIMPSLAKKPLRVSDQGYGANAPATLYDLQGQLGDEAFERRFQAKRAGAPAGEIDALTDLMNKYALAREESPLTAQKREIDQFNTLNREAIMEGFGGGESGPPSIASTMDIDPVTGGRFNESITETPAPNVSPIVARNLFKRKQEQERMRLPLRQEEMRQLGGVQQQQIQANAQRDVARMQGEAQRDVAKTNASTYPWSPEAREFGELQKMLGPGADVRSVNRGGFSLQTPTSQAPMLRQAPVVLQNLINAGGERWLKMDSSIPEQAAYNSYVANIVSTAPIEAVAKEEILKGMSNPNFATLPTDQFLAQVFEVEQLTPQERALAINLLTQIRGGF